MVDFQLWEDEPGPWDDPSWWAPGDESVVDSMDLDDSISDASKAMVVSQPQRAGPNDSNPLVTLPNELKMLITDDFSPRELLRLGTACRSLWPFCRDMALERALKITLKPPPSPPASREPTAALPASLPATNNLLPGPPAPPPVNNNMALVPFNHNAQPGPVALHNNWPQLAAAPFLHQHHHAFPHWLNNNPPVQPPWNINHPPGFHGAPVNTFPPPHLQVVPFMPPPAIPFQAGVPWQPPPPPFRHDPGNNVPAFLPWRSRNYVEPILRTALKYRSTSLLSCVRDCCDRLDEKFEVDKPIEDMEAKRYSWQPPEEKYTLLELVVQNSDQAMAEWLLINGAKPDGKPFVYEPSSEVISVGIVDLVRAGLRDVWRLNTPLCKLLIELKHERGHVCVVGLVKLLLKHGAKAVAPVRFLVELGECKVHAPRSECRLEMAKAFLARPDVDADDSAKARIVNWMERFMPGEGERTNGSRRG